MGPPTLCNHSLEQAEKAPPEKKKKKKPSPKIREKGKGERGNRLSGESEWRRKWKMLSDFEGQ